MGFAWATKSSPGPLFSLIELTNSFPFYFWIFFDLIWHYSTIKKRSEERRVGKEC